MYGKIAKKAWVVNPNMYSDFKIGLIAKKNPALFHPGTDPDLSPQPV